MSRVKVHDLIRSAPKTPESERPIWTGETHRAQHAEVVARARAKLAAEQPLTVWQRVRAMLRG